MPQILSARLAGFLAIQLCAALTARAQPLTFAEALATGVAQSPQIAAQRSALEAAEAAVAPASQLPDPKLVFGIDNLPIDGADRFSLGRDFMTMRRIGLMQDFPRERKRRLRGDKAQADAEREAASLAVSSLDVKRQIAIAWLDTYFSQQQLGLLAELAPEIDLLREVARAQLASGKGSAAEPIAAAVAALMLKDRISEAERQLNRARAALARWVGGAGAARALAAPPDFAILPLAPDRLIAGIAHHPELAIYAPIEAAARADAELARAARQPDLSVEAAYQNRGPAYSNMVSVTVRIDLPLWPAKRQDPLIAARQLDVERVRANRDEALRRHEAEVRADIAAWESARERVARIEAELLPLAQERSAVALAAYRGGRGDLNTLLSARASEIDARIALAEQRAELGRAWAALNFLVDTHKERP